MNPLTEAEIHALNEARHIKALCTLFARYGLPVPENPWPGKVARYASLHVACEAGVGAGR